MSSCAIAWIALLGTSFLLAEPDTPSAHSLLRGARLARTKHHMIRMEFDIEYVSPPRKEKTECLVELDHDKLRFEIMPGHSEGQVTIRTGDEFRGYYRGRNNDVALYDTAYSVGSRGDMAFDPRILGVNDVPLADATVEGSIHLDEKTAAWVIGKEMLNGISTWRVSVASAGNLTIDYWIEESTFRVHRKKMVVPNSLEISLESTFSESDKFSPFPIRVDVRRKSGKRDRHTVYSIRKADLKATFSPDRFTLGSMDLPINTSIIDYRLMRNVGYWDGIGVVMAPVP